MPRVYSHSRISTFETCPLKFKLRYLDKIEPLRGNIEAFMGSRVHDTLEKLYRDKMFQKMCSIDDLIRFYNQRWEKEMHEDICVVKEEYTPDNYRQMGEGYIRTYYGTYKPFTDGVTIALEKKFSFPLNETGYWLTGIIDRLTDAEGSYQIHDYKTSLYLPTEFEVNNDRQLPLYALALQHMYGDANDIELIWHYVAFNKEVRVSKTEQELQTLKHETIKKINEIEDAIEKDAFPPRETSLCPYCEYQSICPLFKHYYLVEALPPAEARLEDGHTLVNTYWDVESKIRELEKRKGALKEKIVAYSQKNKVQYVYGSEKIANIRIYENPWFPDVKDSRRKEVVELLKTKSVYDTYSRLDTIALSNAYKNNELPAPIAKKLKDYVEIRKVSRIYLRNVEREE